MMDKKNIYIPGVCNIGDKDKEDRLRMGLAGIMIASGWTFLSYVWVFPIFLKLFVVVPTFFGILGILQHRESFCVYHAFKEEHRMDNKMSVLITDLNAINKDKQKAMLYVLISLLISFLYTLLVFFMF